MMILYDSRVFIPESLRRYYLELCHEGHQGIEKCITRAHQYFWWPGCTQDITSHVTNCEECIKTRMVKHQPAEETELPSGPWIELGTDILEFRNEIFLLVIDYYSKWMELKKLPCQTAQVVIHEMKKIFSCFGVPALLRADNGPCYIVMLSNLKVLLKLGVSPSRLVALITQKVMVWMRGLLKQQKC